MNKKAFIDGETFQKGGFWILVALGWSATILGWKMSLGMESGGFAVWQLLIILVVIFFAAAWFSRD